MSITFKETPSEFGCPFAPILRQKNEMGILYRTQCQFLSLFRCLLGSSFLKLIEKCAAISFLCSSINGLLALLKGTPWNRQMEEKGFVSLSTYEIV